MSTTAMILTAAAGGAITAVPTTVLAYLGIRRMRRAYEHTREELNMARYDATHDCLTGLSNRRAFYEQATVAVATASPERPLALAIIDINTFKQVNDTFGHGIGDLVLLSSAHELARRVPHGLVARLGGDEFVALVPLDRGESALIVGEALLDASDGVSVDDERVTVTFRVGVAELWEPVELAEALTCADAAMYRAKHQGPGVEVFHPMRDEHGAPISQWPADRVLGVAC